MDEMKVKADQFQLNGLERAKNIHVTNTPFTVINEMITPTQKIKRRNIKTHFITQINNMYS